MTPSNQPSSSGSVQSPASHDAASAADPEDGPSSSAAQPSVTPSGPVEPVVNLPGTSSSLCATDRLLNNNFHDLMPTPKIARKKTRVNRKSINYRASIVTKQLFHDYEESCKDPKKQGKAVAPSARGTMVVQHQTAKTCKPAKGKNLKQITSKSVNKKQNGIKHKVSAKCDKGAKRAKISDSWYCIVCKEDKQLSMAKCSRCEAWFHNECIGLESDDDDDFVCPYCE